MKATFRCQTVFDGRFDHSVRDHRRLDSMTHIFYGHGSFVLGRSGNNRPQAILAFLGFGV